MAKDIYIETLNILNQSYGSLTNEQLAHQIADFVRKEVSDQFMNLIVDFRKNCGGDSQPNCQYCSDCEKRYMEQSAQDARD